MVCFESSRFTVLHQDCQEPVSELTLISDRLDAVNSFNCLESLIKPGGEGHITNCGSQSSFRESARLVPSAVTPGFPSREGFTIKQFPGFYFTIARRDPFT